MPLRVRGINVIEIINKYFSDLGINFSFGNLQQSNQASFNVDNAGLSAFTAGNTITYNITRTNRGSHMNAANGQFTAPTTGVYHFSFTGITETGEPVTQIELRKNGSNTGIRGYSVVNGYQNISINASVSLVRGDIITIFVVEGKIHGNYGSSFSGFFVA